MYKPLVETYDLPSSFRGDQGAVKRGLDTTHAQYEKALTPAVKAKKAPLPNEVICYGEEEGKYLVCEFPDAAKLLDARKGTEVLTAAEIAAGHEPSWRKVRYDQNSEFQGGVKHVAGCITQERSVVLCGGTDPITGRTSALAWICKDVLQPGLFVRTQDMVYRRWAHAVVPLHTKVFAIGGFVNPEAAGAQALSLASVEKYCLESEEWTEVAGMREKRAFCGVTAVQDQFLYVVGGYSDNKMLDTIERYDEILDCWTVLATRLPLAMSKVGVTSLLGTPARIVMLGGLDPAYTRTPWAVKFDCTTEAFEEMPDMTMGRIFGPSSGIHVIDGRNLCAIGGAARDTCE